MLPLHTSRDTLRERAFALHEAQQFEQAEPLYRHVLQLVPNDTEVGYALGVLLLQTQRYADAALLLAAAAAHDDTAAAHCYLASAYAGLGKADEARTHYERAARIDYLDSFLERASGAVS